MKVVLARLALREGAPHHSFDRLFDHRPTLFYDPVHTTDEGNALVARALAEPMLGSGVLAEAS